MGARRHGEVQKILAEIRAKIPLGRIVEKDAAKLLARAKDFSALMKRPARIRRREVEEFEGSTERRVESVLPAVTERANRTIYFAANIPELLHQRERSPSTSGERFVRGRVRHRRINDSTMRRISARTASSSTPRERLPWAGRTLIIESNSIHASADSSG